MNRILSMASVEKGLDHGGCDVKQYTLSSSVLIGCFIIWNYFLSRNFIVNHLEEIIIITITIIIIIIILLL